MRETCEGCLSDLRVVDTYLADEDLRELEVVVWRCPGCGATREQVEPAA